MVNRPGTTLWLLMPEWQGYGLSNATAHGARALAGDLAAHREVLEVPAPEDEDLSAEGGVLGLASIAPRARAALSLLQTRAPDRTMTIGATCGVEVAPIAYHNDRHAGALAVLWLDAHADLNTPESSPSGHFHGMVLRTMLGAGPGDLVSVIPRRLEPSQVVLVGARDLDPPESEYVTSAGVRVAGLEAFNDPVEFARSIRRAGFDRVYLHLDVDVINPEDFKSSLMRTPDGPSLNDVMSLICQVNEQCDIAGFSVVEFCEREAGDRLRLSKAIADVLQLA